MEDLVQDLVFGDSLEETRLCKVGNICEMMLKFLL